MCAHATLLLREKIPGRAPFPDLTEPWRLPEPPPSSLEQCTETWDSLFFPPEGECYVFWAFSPFHRAVPASESHPDLLAGDSETPGHLVPALLLLFPSKKGVLGMCIWFALGKPNETQRSLAHLLLRIKPAKHFCCLLIDCFQPLRIYKIVLRTWTQPLMLHFF